MASVIRFLVAFAVAVVASAGELDSSWSASQLARILVGDVSPTEPLANETVTSTTATATTTTFTTTLGGGGDSPAPTEPPSPEPTNSPPSPAPSEPSQTPSEPTQAPEPPAVDQFSVQWSMIAAVDNAACSDGNFTDAVLKTQASIAEVDESAVQVKCQAIVDEGRRLEDRRTAQESVKLIIVITVGSADDAKTLSSKIDEAKVEEIASMINDLIPEGSPYKGAVLVLSKSPAEAIIVFADGTTGTDSTDGTDGSGSTSEQVAGYTKRNTAGCCAGIINNIVGGQDIDTAAECRDQCSDNERCMAISWTQSGWCVGYNECGEVKPEKCLSDKKAAWETWEKKDSDTEDSHARALAAPALSAAAVAAVAASAAAWAQ